MLGDFLIIDDMLGSVEDNRYMDIQEAVNLEIHRPFAPLAPVARPDDREGS